MSNLWIELMILQTMIGYSFVIANAMIGLSKIGDLNNLKSNLKLVRAHKWYGRTEIFIFYAITAQCLYMFYLHVAAKDPNLYRPSGVWAHSWFGGFLAVVLVSIKLFYAKYKKDEIYKYGHILGPIGVFGWSIAHWTSLFNFYFVVFPTFESAPIFIPLSFLWSAIIPFFIGAALFLLASLTSSMGGMKQDLKNLHGVAMILHGITFGYEGSAKELVGTPVLYKYVFPKTYEFLERYASKIGLDLEELKKYNLNEAMQIAMRKFEDIEMAEKLKVKWISENEFTIESINCSTAVVRSYMKPEELKNSICPWGILAATIANALTGKEIEIAPSEFNEIGAISKLKIVETKASNQ
ncbi:MAG: hypothetical protein GF383_03050 [Candidatus Lokiarchaeota archaeon]|nr:hypothetical protein [Candidatus Lokiarchaeota archaeon]MBD3338517.1 hypothetical protein [Candidatus Lokiarchaeota archaeon]